jgi:hypothetical protein
MNEKILIGRELLERCKLLADDPMGLDFEEHAAIYNELNDAIKAPQTEPVGEEVELDAYSCGLMNDWGGGNVEWWWDYIRHEIGAAHDHYQDQHQRLLEEAKQGQRVLAHEVEQLKARIVWLECEAKCGGKVVLPERRGVTTRKTAADYYNGGWNACLDEVQRLNGAKP